MYDPLYIIGTERSGTNLLRKLITENQAVYFGVSPAHFLKHLYHQAAFYGDLHHDDHFELFVSDSLDLCYRHFAPWDVEFNPRQVVTAYAQTYRRRNPVLLAH